MLKVFRRLKDLDFNKLMAVYEEGNLENGREFYPDDAPSVQLQRAHLAFEEYLREDFFKVPGAFYAVWEEDGTYLSALRMEPYQDGWLLEALETMSKYRKMGHGKRLILAVLSTFPKRSKVYSHVGKRNTASLATHKSCGFRESLDYAKYVDGTVTRYSCTMEISL